MSEHDEFCPMQQGDGLCRCYILRKARTDEREKIAAAIETRLNQMHSDWRNPRYEEAIRIARNGGGDE